MISTLSTVTAYSFTVSQSSVQFLDKQVYDEYDDFSVQTYRLLKFFCKRQDRLGIRLVSGKKEFPSLNDAVDRGGEKIALDMPLGELELAEHRGA